MSAVAKVHRPVKGHLRVQAPYVAGAPTRGLLKRAGCQRIEWDGRRRVWLVSRARMAQVVAELRTLWDVDVWIDGYATQKCDIRCQAAVGTECICACAGANHGRQQVGDMVQVGENTLISFERMRSHFTVAKAVAA